MTIQTSITLFGFILHEPVTVLTDLIWCAGCVLFSYKVSKYNVKYWPLFFASMALATFFGALGHGLFADKNNMFQMISRLGGVISVYVASIASLFLLTKSRGILFLYIFSFIQVSTAILLVIMYNEFWVVKLNGTIGVGVLVAGIHFSLSLKGSKGSIYILSGIILNSITWFIHKYEISPSYWFNHNDLSHIILLFGFYLMAHGAIQLPDYTNAKVLS